MSDRPRVALGGIGPPRHAPALGFLWNRLKLTLNPRGGAAPSVPFDRDALAWEPAVTWIGHSTMFVRMDGAAFLTDPMFSQRCSPIGFAGPARLVQPGVPLDQVPAVDFVTLSHDHYDHTDRASIERLAARGTVFVVATGMAELVQRFGGKAIELAWWEHADVGGVRVHCVPAKHFSGRTFTDRNRRLWAGFVVEGRSRRFYHAGDTAYFPGFREIGERLGPIDLAAIPIGAYLPTEMMRPVHVDPEEALQAGLDVGARRSLAMHFGTFDLADEPVEEPPQRFLAAAQRAGLDHDRTWVMKIGETRRF